MAGGSLCRDARRARKFTTGVELASPSGSKLRGLTLIELLVTVVILGIAIPPLLRIFAEAGPDSVFAERQIVASFLAQDKMEAIVADLYASSRGYDHLAASNYPVESSISGFPGFSRAVAFAEVSATDLSTPQTDSGYLKVTVTVADTASSGGFTLVSILCELS